MLDLDQQVKPYPDQAALHGAKLSAMKFGFAIECFQRGYKC